MNNNNNGKNLLDKMSEIDPRLITDADKKPRRARDLLIGFTSGMATVAAAAVITITAVNNTPRDLPGVVLSDPSLVSSTDSTSSTNSGSSTSSTQDPPVIDNTPKDPPTFDFSKYKHLPLITNVSDYGVNAQGGRKEEYLNYSELDNRSPWNGEELETMPVYMSSSTNVDLDKMYAYIKKAAAALGFPESELEITDTYPSLEFQDQHRKLMEDAGVSEEEIQKELDRMTRTVVGMTQVIAKADGIEIDLDTGYRLYIKFDPLVELPEGYNFNDNASAEEKAAVLNYLTDKYKDLIGFSKPTLGYTYDTRQFSIYDADCELEQQIVNYWTSDVYFIDSIEWSNYDELVENENKPHKLGYIDINSLEGCEKLGDYPILTPDQALQILQSNKYSDEDRMPANAKILKTDIVYRNHNGCTAVMPYYKFYVETDKETYFDKEVTCDVYTIAAVPEEFIDIETNDYGVYA